MDHDTTPMRLGEMFCGAGGIAEGARQAGGFVPAWAIDRDRDACDTFRAMHGGEVICGDVREIDPASLAPIDAFAFGFPCNDFSLVGERRAFDGEYGPLYTYGVAVLRELRPAMFLAENVSGVRADGALDRILADLEGCGYRLSAHLYDFSRYGVPQRRQRVVIIGFRDDLDATFRVPDPARWDGADISARTALAGIPDGDPHHRVVWPSAPVRERLERIPPGRNAWNSDLPERLQINVKPGGARISSMYRRLHPDQPSMTITAAGGGGHHGYHFAEPRALTNRERARLQTFPDSYRFAGGSASVRRQIGMAVPPAGAAAILAAARDSLAGRRYPSIPASILEMA